MSQMFRSFEANSGTIQRKQGRLKKAVQQGRRAFGARSVHGVREHAKSPRTQLAAFFNIPRKGSEDLATSSASEVDSSNLRQVHRQGFPTVLCDLYFLAFGQNVKIGNTQSLQLISNPMPKLGFEVVDIHWQVRLSDFLKFFLQ